MAGVRFNDKDPILTGDISTDDIIPITDLSNPDDDKKITVGQIATFAENQNSSIAGTKIFQNGVELQKGSIAFGQYSPLPTGIGSYIAQYTHPTYGARLLGYNGSAYQDLSIGSMPTAGTFSMKSLANGNCNFGYNVNIAEDLGVTGDITANKFIGDGSELSNVVTKNITQIGTCTTASATAEKDVTLSGFNLVKGATVQVNFTNQNIVPGSYLAVNFLNGNANDDYGMYTPTVIGAPTFTNNKFNSNGVTGLKYPITSLGSGSWCIQGKFNFTNMTSVQALFSSIPTSGTYLELERLASGKLTGWLSSNGTDLNIMNNTNGSKVFDNNTDYYVRMRFTGTQYLLDWSLTGLDGSWINDISVTSSLIMPLSIYGLNFGLRQYTETLPLVGTMDELYVSVGSSTIQDTRLTLNINNLGAKPIASEDGVVCSATNPSYFPAGVTVEFTYNGTYFTYKNRIVTNYVNGQSWYNQWTNGWIEQGGKQSMNGGTAYTVTYPLAFKVSVLGLQATIGHSFTNQSWDGVYAVMTNLTTCSIMSQGNTGTGDVQWEACGY